MAGIVVALSGVSAAQATQPHPGLAACPASVADKATCYTGQDANGAYYAIAVPKQWNGSLVVHAHGGPDLGEGSDPERSIGDLDRWSVMVDEGYAWASSSYRRGGYGTRMAAADTENLRRLFVDEFGKPKRTYVHGQSWGGNVAAKVVEVYGKKHGPYDGALLTSGVLVSGSRGYDYRVDLRVIYQYYCQNLPRPSEPQYPLWQGLRPTSTLTTAGLRARLQECTDMSRLRRSAPHCSNATLMTSSQSRTSRSERWSRTCASPCSPSATSCTTGLATVIPSTTRVCGTPVHTTTRH